MALNNRREFNHRNFENIKEKAKSIKNFDYWRYLCCTKDREVTNRVKEVLELSHRLDKAKEQIYDLSHNAMAIGFKNMRRKGIREICDRLYNEAKRFEQSATDDIHDKNKFDFSVKYIEHFQKDLTVYVHRQPEKEADLMEVTSKGSVQSVRPLRLTFEELSLLQVGMQAKKMRE